jgi:hypothetical protein
MANVQGQDFNFKIQFENAPKAGSYAVFAKTDFLSFSAAS